MEDQNGLNMTVAVLLFLGLLSHYIWINAKQVIEVNFKNSCTLLLLITYSSFCSVQINKCRQCIYQEPVCKELTVELW